MRRALLAALVAAAGCGGGAGGDGPDGGDDGGPDARDRPDATLGPDAGPCGALDVDPPWLDAMLAGAIETLAEAPRASAAAREATRDWLAGELAAQGIASELHTYGTGANVIARLPGDGTTEEWVLLGAHFDSVSASPGANDNATGVAAVLAAARLLRDTCRRRGVIIAFLDEEEIGLIGATYLAEALFVAGEEVVEVHTVDQVGWDQDGDRVYEIELPTDAIWADYQAAAAALGLGVSRTTTSGTDHSAFREQGFAAAGVTEEYAAGDTTPHYHEPGDTYATVQPYLGFTAGAVRLISRVVAAAAQ